MKHLHDTHNRKKKCCDKKELASKQRLLKKILEAFNRYRPLIIILAFCLLIPLFQITPFDAQKFMYSVMGYFFLFLSLFKFFDLKTFVIGFKRYDLITKHFQPYGYLYPFLEFGLGIAYLIQSHLFITNWITLIIMLISGTGALKSILSGEKIKCACLGTVLNVPLSTISLLENFGMAGMAAYSLLLFY